MIQLTDDFYKRKHIESDNYYYRAAWRFFFDCTISFFIMMDKLEPSNSSPTNSKYSSVSRY